MSNYYDIFLTEMGWVGAVKSDAGIRRTTFPFFSYDKCWQHLFKWITNATRSEGRLSEIREFLQGYFGGESLYFVNPLDYLDTSLFNRDVWDECRKIPIGETRSYSSLAFSIMRPKAARAVGQAMANNPLPIVIPCHRVISKSGSLGGFCKGEYNLKLKQKLLDLEKRTLGLAKPIIG